MPEKEFLVSQTFLQIASKLSTLTREVVILDLGCGKGQIVRELRRDSYAAYGCDFIDKQDISDFNDNIQKQFEDGILRPIKMSPYRLPFEDNTFDYIFSSQVFEHVMDYDITLKEILRILKPGGFSLNIFPGRYLCIEPHVFVPIASIIRNKVWLLFWACLGIRNSFQKGKSAMEVATLNYNYLNKCTNYLTQKQILNYAERYFEVSFREDLLFELTRSKKAKLAKLIFKLFPSLLVFFSALHTRVLVLRK